ncbi:MAG: LysR family transcriptional regulator [Betaproteobacteria bacterium]|nr:LysR family transcriptional regulator [Betaproteobacteria bacterium]MDE2211582.1 LysR family transcriptional regulator [Betaproteobacteria bacterium]MDE2624162.1 LysR family transcriptional regulator [Betaproteobacteria bacterium]
MRHATLRQLKVFETVARRLSFSRAAEELHLSQPAVSTQVKQLEDHAGLPLFEQLGKRIFLTPAGREMLRHSRAIITQFREAEEAMAQLKGISGGTLNVSVISAGDYFFPHLLAEFYRRHEGIKLNLDVTNRQELLQKLNENLTDLAVMVRPPLEMDVVAEPFAPHPYVIVAPPDHPLAGQKRIPRSDLLSQPFITRELGSDTWNSMQDVFGEDLGKLQMAFEIRSTETIKQAVMAGMGIAFVSAHNINLELQVGNLVILDVENFPAMLNWYVVHRKDKHLPPVAQAFKGFLLEQGAQLIESFTRFKVNTPTLGRRSKRSQKASRDE